jgi:hypothetical protein
VVTAEGCLCGRDYTGRCRDTCPPGARPEGSNTIYGFGSLKASTLVRLPSANAGHLSHGLTHLPRHVLSFPHRPIAIPQSPVLGLKATTCPFAPVSPRCCADAALVVHSHPPTHLSCLPSCPRPIHRPACLSYSTCPSPSRPVYRTGSASCHISTVGAPCALIRSLATSLRATPHCESVALPNVPGCPYLKPTRSTHAHLSSKTVTIQLGVDYQGGTENIYKCVRIRVEIGREWQASANAFK